MKKILLIIVTMTLSHFAIAQDAYIGEIRMFTGNFAPRGWILCQGQTLSIAQNAALFSILGTTYGGDGVNTFRLPDLQGRVPIQQGRSSSGRIYSLGEVGGTESNTLTTAQMPAHTHGVTVALPASNDEGTSDDPTGRYLAVPGTNSYSSTSNVALAPLTTTVSPTGASQPIENMQPYLVVNYIICLQGIYPSRE